jgi:hypothetical protein
MERRVDRQQVGQEVAGGVDKLVDPLDPHRPVVLSLDRQRRGVVDPHGPAALRRGRTVAPHGRSRETRGQDLLGELPHRNLVVVDRLATRRDDGARPRHHRRDQQRRRVLRHRQRVERAAQDRCRGDRHAEQPAADLADDEQPGTRAPTDAQEISPGQP